MLQRKIIAHEKFFAISLIHYSETVILSNFDLNRLIDTNPTSYKVVQIFYRYLFWAVKLIVK